MDYKCLEAQIELFYYDILTHEPLALYLVPFGGKRWELRTEASPRSGYVGTFKRPISLKDLREEVFETLHTMRPG